MITAPSLTPDSHGWFEPVVEPAPPEWPWALPHLYTVNVAPDPGVEIIGAHASPDGSGSVREGWVADRTRIETVGYWHGALGLVDCDRARTAVSALRRAENRYRSRRVRFLMAAGRVRDENPAVQVTGNWPTRWEISKVSDLGVFCAFLFERARAAGGGAAADAFRRSIHRAWPLSEQILVFVRALETAQGTLEPHLDGETRDVLSRVLTTAKGWL